MNGFAEHGLDDDAFKEKPALTKRIKTFDAFRRLPHIFPLIKHFVDSIGYRGCCKASSNLKANSIQSAKTKASYAETTTTGGYTTIILLILSLVLIISELSRWWNPTPINGFSVEKGVSHELQINLDIVMPMHCSDIHINVQDASGDRILAGDMLMKDDTAWGHWVDYNGRKNKLQHDFDQGGGEWEKGVDEDSRAAHVVGEVGGSRRRRKWPKTPRLWGEGGSCRIYGSLEGNKVQGDFHITARGHGYMEIGEHLDHRGRYKISSSEVYFQHYPQHFIHSSMHLLTCFFTAFNFSHLITHLSFGPHYPSLLNPLSATLSTTPHNFHKYQYYLSVVPTVYSTSSNALRRYLALGSPPSLSENSNLVVTNQYAVTSQSHEVDDRTIPGIFFKFDIEPVQLTVLEERRGLGVAMVRIVNVVSGVLVGGGWCYALSGWARGMLAKGKGVRGGLGAGMLNGLAEKGGYRD